MMANLARSAACVAGSVEQAAAERREGVAYSSSEPFGLHQVGMAKRRGVLGRRRHADAHAGS
jgi:hypothetical protein